MSTEPDKRPDRPEPHLSVLAADPTSAPDSGSQGSEGRAVAQLRARIEQLESALADSVVCLEDAERRAAELVSMRARVAHLESVEHELAVTQQKLLVIVTSKSWRLTTPLRRAMERARPSVRR
jgi:hypothetical protein